MTSLSPQSSTISEFDLEAIAPASETMLGYYVTSTASINVEDEPPQLNTSVKSSLSKIAQYLVNSPHPQIVISIHGYGTRRSDARARFAKIYQYATQICQPKTSVFLGYCWPSENPVQDDAALNQKPNSFRDKLAYAFESLPTLLIGLFSSTLVLSIISALLIIIGQPNITNPLTIFAFIALFSILGTIGILKFGKALALFFDLPIWVLALASIIGIVAVYSSINITWFLVISFSLFTISFAIILALMALRLSTYLRDGYRAENYGVLDLVELVRQLDQAVFEAKLIERLQAKEEIADLPSDIQNAIEEWQNADGQKKLELWRSVNPKSKRKLFIEQEVISELNQIKLTFLGHSMGCFVVTNTIRILSDVFDTNSIGKTPSSNIGRAFCLGRLILVAPDIPVETIMPRRANFLRSSLRRCEEAYLFSNEGDLALRLASTAANYFRFPGRTRFSGYRLGNLTVHSEDNLKGKPSKSISDAGYGIINFRDGKLTEAQPYRYLEIRASERESYTLNEIRPLETTAKETTDSCESIPVADLFTYFDCTDYVDYTDSDPTRSKGVVSYALRKPALTIWDYINLSIAYFVKQGKENINVHGGFFDGKFSQQAIYELAFRGFRGFLETLKPGYSTSEQLSDLSKECRQKYIQVVLSSRVKEIL
ncbi:MAG TPA: hypothetical protein DDZ80_02050 [Cyanobacteria bacterium UBA8803]|nr:hypothetical protein [Cyanobacteria bacterium UBA9273]HBL57369.1 hypothetical protein [Cyanobacteria bacterium UBA8803]